MAPDTPLLLHELGLFRVSRAWDEALKRAIVRALLPYDKPPKASPTSGGSVKATYVLDREKGDFTLFDLKTTYEAHFEIMLRSLVVYRAVENGEFQSLARKIGSFDGSPHADHGISSLREGWYLDGFTEDLVRELGARKDYLTRPLWDAMQAAVPKVKARVSAHQDGVARRRLAKALKAAMEAGLTDEDVMTTWRSVIVQDVMTK